MISKASYLPKCPISFVLSTHIFSSFPNLLPRQATKSESLLFWLVSMWKLLKMIRSRRLNGEVSKRRMVRCMRYAGSGARYAGEWVLCRELYAFISQLYMVYTFVLTWQYESVSRISMSLVSSNCNDYTNHAMWFPQTLSLLHFPALPTIISVYIKCKEIFYASCIELSEIFDV